MQKTAYEMLFSDWSSDVCSSDLFQGGEPTLRLDLIAAVIERCTRFAERQFVVCTNLQSLSDAHLALFDRDDVYISTSLDGDVATHTANRTATPAATRSEEHTSELQSLMRNSYAVFCLKKKTQIQP